MYQNLADSTTPNMPANTPSHPDRGPTETPLRVPAPLKK